MQVSMDGLRTQLTRATERLKDEFLDAVDMQLHDRDSAIEAMNDVIQLVNNLNCISSGAEQDFSDLSGRLWVESINEDENEEDEDHD